MPGKKYAGPCRVCRLGERNCSRRIAQGRLASRRPPDASGWLDIDKFDGRDFIALYARPRRNENAQRVNLRRRDREQQLLISRSGWIEQSCQSASDLDVNLAAKPHFFSITRGAADPPTRKNAPIPSAFFPQTSLCDDLCLGLRFVLVLFTLSLELSELLWSQDLFRLLHVFDFGRLRATRFVMLGHDLVHLRLLIRRQIETGERDRACRLSGIAGLLRAIAVFTREHRAR